MINIIQGLLDNKVQVVINGVIRYEFTNSTVELKDSHLQIVSGGNALVTLWSKDCEWFLYPETP